jgi:hypothetical protein
MDDANFHAEMNAKMAQMLRNNPSSTYYVGQNDNNQITQNAQQPNPPFYPPSYYQMNPHLPIPIDYPYVVPTR